MQTKKNKFKYQEKAVDNEVKQECWKCVARIAVVPQKDLNLRIFDQSQGTVGPIWGSLSCVTGTIIAVYKSKIPLQNSIPVIPRIIRFA